MLKLNSGRDFVASKISTSETHRREPSAFCEAYGSMQKTLEFAC